MSESQQEWIDGLRALADFAEAHPDEWFPYSPLHVNVFAEDAKGLAEKARAFGGHFDKVDDSFYFNLRKTFGPHHIDICATHEAVCERVQIGTETKEVPDPEALAAVPKVTIEEPIYEWKCPESILSETAA